MKEPRLNHVWLIDVEGEKLPSSRGGVASGVAAAGEVALASIVLVAIHESAEKWNVQHNLKKAIPQNSP